MPPARCCSLLALAWFLSACAHEAQRPADLAPLRPIPADVAAFVRAAVADRFRAGDIPDQNLIAGQDPVLVFDEMETSAYRMGGAALPQVRGARFALIDRTAARDRAYGTGSGTFMIEADSVELRGTTASLKLGIGIYPDVSAANFVVMCCCTARANFRWLGGQWSFDGWGERTCF
jgi:hypothetical protein